jgi:hypothetical protein
VLAVLSAGAALAAAGCAGAGPAGAARAPGASRSRPAPCAAAVASTLRGVVARIYAQAASGRNVIAAQRRLARSAALSAAVERADAAATRAALRPLLRDQIHRIVVRRGAHLLADLGRARALAPVSGFIDDAAGRPVGRYTMSVAEQAAIAGIVRSTTGATATVTRHTPAHATFALPVQVFPRGARALAVTLEPQALTSCGTTSAATAVATDLAIARRLYATEAGGPAVRRVLRHVSHDARFRRAVARDSYPELRAAIIRFFRTRSLHVVRIRATDARGRLVGDVGGPYVLAPASAPVLGAHGRRLGRVTLSVQDDTGYIKLLSRFTGAKVQLRTAAGLVPGSARRLPAHAQRLHLGARAFPTGALRVTFAVPQTA